MASRSERRRRREETHADEATREDGPAGQASPRRHRKIEFELGAVPSTQIASCRHCHGHRGLVHQLLKRLPFCRATLCSFSDLVAKRSVRDNGAQVADQDARRDESDQGHFE